MKCQVEFCCAVLLISVINEFSCVPIFTEEESLKSIVISELDLPTEPTVLGDKADIAEPEKPETFVELYEKYNDLYIKNTTIEVTSDDDSENPLQKRSSMTDDELKGDSSAKSIIERLQIIEDPEVRKVFEMELTPFTDDLSEKKSTGELEYDPNYAKKIVNVTELKENEAENLTLEDFGKSLPDLTTVAPEEISSRQIVNPEAFEVIEKIFIQPQEIESRQLTTIDPLLNVQIDFDPIQIISKDDESLRNIDTEPSTLNDKFVGYQPSEDLIEPGEETTESDKFFEKEDKQEEENSADRAAETLIDTLELVGIYGKSLKDEISTEKNAETKETEKDFEISSTPSTIEMVSTASPTIPSVTEIVEVHTEISINIRLDEPTKRSEKSSIVSLIDELTKPTEKENSIVKHSSSFEKSSDESKSSKSSKSSDSKEKLEKADKSSSESSEENSAKEVFDSNAFRSIFVQIKDSQNALMEDLYKETLSHDVKKKDHPTDLSLPNEVIERKFSNDIKPIVTPDETTTVGIYDTIEDIVTTVSDGIKLTNEFRSAIDSFRDYADENKTVLDTNNEAISSKNIKNSLVNIAEEMTLENHNMSPLKSEMSYVMVSVIGLVSAIIVVSFFLTLRRKTRFVLF